MVSTQLDGIKYTYKHDSNYFRIRLAREFHASALPCKVIQLYLQKWSSKELKLVISIK